MIQINEQPLELSELCISKNNAVKIHHIRNATMVIETGQYVILVDPMIGPQGTMPPFSFFKSKPRRNPIVSMPEDSDLILERITHCLITHNHPDHLDKDAITYLINKNIPVYCSKLDKKTFKKKGLNVVKTLDYWVTTDFLGGTIEGIPARHGYGFVAKPAGNVMGYYIKLLNEKSIYLSSDTIYTKDVDKVLKKYKPEISVVAAGSARFDFFKPLLMTKDDILKFIKNTPGMVIANHLEAVNHCPTTRKDLKELVLMHEVNQKTLIPEDGDIMRF